MKITKLKTKAIKENIDALIAKSEELMKKIKKLTKEETEDKEDKEK